MAWMGLDSLKAQQLASAMAAASNAYIPTASSGQGRLAASLQDTAQGGVAAEAAIKAAKKAKKKSSGIGAIAGTVGGALLAAPTGGMSLAAGAALGGSLGGAADSAISGNYGGAAAQLGTAAGQYGQYKAGSTGAGTSTSIDDSISAMSAPAIDASGAPKSTNLTVPTGMAQGRPDPMFGGRATMTPLPSPGKGGRITSAPLPGGSPTTSGRSLASTTTDHLARPVQPITRKQARAMGLSPQQIQQLRRQGMIEDRRFF